MMGPNVGWLPQRTTMTDTRHAKTTEEPDAEKPPIFRSWLRFYLAVLVHLALWILVFYLFTVRFAFDFPQ